MDVDHPVISEEEFYSGGYTLVDCKDDCPYFKGVNACCSLSWKRKWYGYLCDYGLVEKEGKYYKVAWGKGKAF